MSWKETMNHLNQLLHSVAKDLEKVALTGNKSAAQRVRTGTVRLEKVAKRFRKESIAAEKSGQLKRKPKPKPQKKKAKKKAKKR